MSTKKSETKPVIDKTNLVDEKNTKTLNDLKDSINKRYADIEHNFYLIGLDLIKVNMYVKNFRKWVEDNTEIDVSTAYTLMRLVKRDKELSDSNKYNVVRPKICLSKLIKMLKYPADFVDQLDFEKEYELPGGKKCTLIDMPRDAFGEAIAHEFKMLTAKEKGEDVVEDAGVPMDRLIISQAKEKLDKLLNELQTIFTVLSEVNVNDDTKEAVEKTVQELEGIEKQASHIHDTAEKLLDSLKKSNAKSQKAVA
jgi:hypothetical protein